MKRSLAIALSLISVSAFAGDPHAALIEDSRDVLEEFKQTDPTLAATLDEAVGYAVFPTVGKGGFIVGAGRGEGVLFEKGVPVGKLTLKQFSVGAQIGGQEFSELLVIKTRSALKELKRGRGEVQASASAVAADKGAARKLEYRAGVAVMTKARTGAMAEATIGGQKFDYEPFAETTPGT